MASSSCTRVTSPGRRSHYFVRMYGSGSGPWERKLVDCPRLFDSWQEHPYNPHKWRNKRRSTATGRWTRSEWNTSTRSHSITPSSFPSLRSPHPVSALVVPSLTGDTPSMKWKANHGGKRGRPGGGPPARLPPLALGVVDPPPLTPNRRPSFPVHVPSHASTLIHPVGEEEKRKVSHAPPVGVARAATRGPT